MISASVMTVTSSSCVNLAWPIGSELDLRSRIMSRAFLSWEVHHVSLTWNYQMPNSILWSHEMSQAFSVPLLLWYPVTFLPLLLCYRCYLVTFVTSVTLSPWCLVTSITLVTPFPQILTWNSTSFVSEVVSTTVSSIDMLLTCSWK